MRTEVVAELSCNHNGSLDRAVRLIDAAKFNGASTIKLQCYTPDELVYLRGDGPAPEPWGSQGWSMRRLYEKAQTPHDWFPILAKHCDNIGMPWFSSVFGPESLELLESLNCPRYKIAALDNGHAGLLRAVRQTGKPIMASARTGTDISCDWLLLCPAGYPQEQIRLTDIPDSFTGFSYHGTDPFIPALSVAYGARIVEVHFQLFAEPSELESSVSLYDFQFREMVRMIERIEAVQ
jgi:pseudaminic acid synthase